MELNQLYKKYIVLDLDIPGSAFLWDDLGLPPPTIVTVNPINAHCHYLYELVTPVIYTPAGRAAPQRYYEAIERALTEKLKADTAYIGKFTKSPFYPGHKVICHNRRYELDDFKEWGIQPAAVKHSRKKHPDADKGRNCRLFHDLRLWAYDEVKKHHCPEAFQRAIEAQAFVFNILLTSDPQGTLQSSEVMHTVRSVSKWTWKRRFDLRCRKTVLNLPTDLDLCQKQAAGARHAHECRNSKSLQCILGIAQQLKTQGKPITQQAVALATKKSLSTIKRYWSKVDQQLGLYIHNYV